MAVSRYIVMGCVFTYLVASEFHSESMTSGALKLNLELRKKRHRKTPSSEQQYAFISGQWTDELVNQLHGAQKQNEDGKTFLSESALAFRQQIVDGVNSNFIKATTPPFNIRNGGEERMLIYPGTQRLNAGVFGPRIMEAVFNLFKNVPGLMGTLTDFGGLRMLKDSLSDFVQGRQK